MSLADTRRYLRDALTDLRLFVTGKADRELPPLRLRRVGKGDFRKMGEWVVSFLVTHGLKKDDRVLDIGCGVGRVAIALTRFLSPAASYDGFDAVGRIVRWCSRNITPKHPNFHFTHAKVVASHYNRKGGSAAGYRFPFEDGAFDFAFATSVFTHMELDETSHYVSEAHRVLRPGGLLVATVFLLDAGTQAPGRGCGLPAASVDSVLPPDLWVVEITRGKWRVSGSFSVTGQDVVVARKK